MRRSHCRMRREEPLLKRLNTAELPFGRLIASWFPLAYVSNNLNRSMGLADALPFVLSTPAIESRAACTTPSQHFELLRFARVAVTRVSSAHTLDC